ncbi:hypothetical protein K0M31_009256 [Melipona bicolor]|uniref:Uncharacterized protein n=1 Tax=Melipona bicolor TaxID=60889 RepID=A0AA40KJR2_9HYME|nr:hypothetical protein K0M31_009256 [Melipona bicolor]
MAIAKNKLINKRTSLCELCLVFERYCSSIEQDPQISEYYLQDLRLRHTTKLIRQVHYKNLRNPSNKANYEKEQTSIGKIADQTTNGSLRKQTIYKSCVFVGLSTSQLLQTHVHTDGSKESHQQESKGRAFEIRIRTNTQLGYIDVYTGYDESKSSIWKSGGDQRTQHVATSVAILLVLAELHFPGLPCLFANVRGSP